MPILKVIGVVFTLLFLSSCATIFRSDIKLAENRTINITGSPPGAEVYMAGDKLGTTPLKYTLTKIRGAEVVVKKEGYVSAYIKIEKVLNPGWIAVSIVAGAPIIFLSFLVPWPIIVDFRKETVFDVKNRELIYNLKTK